MPTKPMIFNVNSFDFVHHPDQEVVVTARELGQKNKQNLPHRTVFGTKYVPLIMTGLNKQASQLLLVLIENRDIYTNETQHTVKGAKEKCQLSRAYKELNKKDLVKRVRNTWYMINPDAVLPWFDDHAALLQKWKTI
jgi:hypothetical protein